MGNKNPVAAGNSNSAEKASTVPKDTIASQCINIQRVQNALLIWLDSSIDNNNEDSRNTIIELRRVVNDISTYTDSDQCIQFINTITNNKVCLIISGALGQQVVPRIHNMSQVDSIFIFCGNKKRHEQWAEEWSKIKGIFTEISPLCEAIEQVVQQREQNDVSINFMAANSGDASNEILDQLDPSFIYTQILKEIVLSITFEQQHIKEFSDYCREVFVMNGHEPKHVDRFEREYHNKTPIWWYTCENFLYHMLDYALRIIDVDSIVRMGFFIGDLHRHIEQLHSEQFGSQYSGESFTVYRGQGLSKKDFEQITNAKGGLISFNNFLITNKNPDVSIAFAESNQDNPDLVGILFVLIIDPSKSTALFALIRDVSYFQEEDEVLFSMHTVFRINDIKPIDGNNRLFEVTLTLTSDNDKDLRDLTDRIQEESFPNVEGWYRLGLMLFKMGQSNKAQEVYQALLDQTTYESERAPIYSQLGSAKYNQGEYQEAIVFYEKSLEIDQKTLPSNHPDLGVSYHNIGLVYESMGDYSNALSSHEKALEIRQKSLPPNHPDLASSYNNTGNMHYNMCDYSKALSSYEKVLTIKQQSLPPNHLDLADSYSNIGLVYDSMGDHSKALSSYEKALAIQQESLPSNHPDLSATYNNIGAAYEDMRAYSTACFYYERAVEIGQQSLTPNHPKLQKCRKNLELMKKKL
jgi:tetratricopeptide (TPR) repeat protein